MLGSIGCLILSIGSLKDAGTLNGGIESSKFPNICGWNPSDSLCPFRSLGFNMRYQFIKSIRPLLHKIFIIQIFFDDDMHQSDGQGTIRSWTNG